SSRRMVSTSPLPPRFIDSRVATVLSASWLRIMFSFRVINSRFSTSQFNVFSSLNHRQWPLGTGPLTRSQLCTCRGFHSPTFRHMYLYGLLFSLLGWSCLTVTFPTSL